MEHLINSINSLDEIHKVKILLKNRKTQLNTAISKKTISEWSSLKYKKNNIDIFLHDRLYNENKRLVEKSVGKYWLCIFNENYELFKLKSGERIFQRIGNENLDECFFYSINPKNGKIETITLQYKYEKERIDNVIVSGVYCSNTLKRGYYGNEYEWRIALCLKPDIGKLY
jgi:hypothetical protein